MKCAECQKDFEPHTRAIVKSLCIACVKYIVLGIRPEDEQPIEPDSDVKEWEKDQCHGEE